MENGMPARGIYMYASVLQRPWASILYNNYER